MMFHLVNTNFIFYLDIQPQKFKAVPHLLLLVITALILFDAPEKEQLLVRVHVNTIIIGVLVILSWFTCTLHIVLISFRFLYANYHICR
jgi:hypothetical protein